ncbi:MAG: YlbF family regulator [Bacillota bacterium]|nr:YlbF family regulator [Bacillota bacterium]
MYIYDKAHELAGVLKESKEFQEYKSLKEKVYADERTRDLLEEYRKMQFEAQAAYLGGKEPDAGLMEKMQKLGELLQYNPDVTAFFMAERSFHCVLSDIYGIIGEAAEVDLSFLKE